MATETEAAVTEQRTNSDAIITLHWLETSRSHRLMWLLEELKLPYKLKTYKRTKDRLADPRLKEVHPLGKAPVLTIETPGNPKPLVLAESGAIVEYVLDHYGPHMIPEKWAKGKEGHIGGETESWMRYRYFMHYAEGSLMSILLVGIFVQQIQKAPVPFFLKFVTNGIAGKINSLFLKPNYETHYGFLEDQLATSPDGGQYLCGKELTGADILMSFPLEAGAGRSGMKKEDFPKVWAYIEKLQGREAYKRAVQKIVEVEGEFKTHL